MLASEAMARLPDSTPPPEDMPSAAEAPFDDRLDSWKEIAAHLKRSVSTVQRWEHLEGLPVRRHPHGKLGSVYASRAEVDAWWEATKVVLSRRNGAAEGEQDQETSTAVPAGRRVTLNWLWVAAFLVVAAMTGFSLSRRPASDAEAVTPAVASLAVLPLKDIGEGSGDGWFADGVTDAIRMALSKTSQVTVIAGTSSRLYENTPKRTRDICRELGVDAVLEGTVQRGQGRVRVNVALVDGRTERRLRTVSSERESSNVLDLYADVARQVEAGLAPAFRTKDRAFWRTVNPEAYDAYLRGHYLRNRRQGGGCARAVPYLKEAIRLDPAIAEAHADLAFCYGFDHLAETLSAEQGAALGRAEAERALALDARLPQAYVALGLLQHRFDYDWVGAERNLKKALELDPNQVDALCFYAELLYLSGRRDEGLAMFRQAAAVDPFHPDHSVGLGFALFNLGLLDESVRQFRHALDLEPGSSLARFWLAETLAAQGRRDEAVAEYLAFLRGSLAPGRAAGVADVLRRTYEERGWTAFWRAELALAEEDAASSGTVWNFPPRTRQPYPIARRHARLGGTEQALAALERACEQRDYIAVFLRTDPVFAPLRHDPRFQALVRRIGAPPAAGR